MYHFLNLQESKRGFRELAKAIVDAAESGRLPPGTPLPPSRILADSLGVSRDTVLRTYRHLQSLGWTETHSTRGTFISARAVTPLTVPASKRPHTVQLSSYAAELIGETDTARGPHKPITYTAVPKEYLPINRWRAASQRTAEPISSRALNYDVAVLGRPEFRNALSAYLNHRTGIAATADEIVVFNSSFSAVALICRAFLEPGDVIATEEPGYGGVWDVARYLGLEVMPVPLDAEGISVDAIARAQSRIKLVYVTPNHQEPKGMTMSHSRRKQLLAWAQRTNALIVEDDFDGLLNYGTPLPPPIKSMDSQDNVIYLGTFWQIIYPLATLCFAVFPYSFIDVIQKLKQKTAGLIESLPQLVLAEMLNDGYLQKHIRKVERDLAARRRSVIYELKRAFGDKVVLPSQSGGLTMTARFAEVSDQALLEAAGASKMPLITTETFYVDAKHRPPGECLIYFAGMEDVRKTIVNFAQYLDDRCEP